MLSGIGNGITAAANLATASDTERLGEVLAEHTRELTKLRVSAIETMKEVRKQYQQLRDLELITFGRRRKGKIRRSYRIPSKGYPSYQKETRTYLRSYYS